MRAAVGWHPEETRLRPVAGALARTGPAAAYAHDTRAALERETVDALASDYLLFGPPIAAERAAVPTALLVVVFHGAGVRLRPSAKPDAIRAAVERVIREPSFRAAAERIGASITADAAAQRGPAELEALASATGS